LALFPYRGFLASKNADLAAEMAKKVAWWVKHFITLTHHAAVLHPDFPIGILYRRKSGTRTAQPPRQLRGILGVFFLVLWLLGPLLELLKYF
tara:strand:- start:53 stop:328 length:276 start_codon:yes stop_codon:yes gene_type:complete